MSLQLITIELKPEGFDIIVVAHDAERAEHYRKLAEAHGRTIAEQMVEEMLMGFANHDFDGPLDP